MKTHELLLIGLLVVASGYSAWMTIRASRLRTELTALRASHLRLQESHRQIRHSFVQLAARPECGDEAFRTLVSVLESDGSADIITPSDPGSTRINKAPGLQIR